MTNRQTATTRGGKGVGIARLHTSDPSTGSDFSLRRKNTHEGEEAAR